MSLPNLVKHKCCYIGKTLCAVPNGTCDFFCFCNAVENEVAQAAWHSNRGLKQKKNILYCSIYIEM